MMENKDDHPYLWGQEGKYFPSIRLGWIFNPLTARLVDRNDVMGMKCCNGNSNEGMDMSIGNEDSFFWCA